MPNVFHVPHDLGIKPIPPRDRNDPRVPTAEEFSLQSEIIVALFKESGRSLWESLPTLTVAPPRTLSCSGGIAHLKGYPVKVELPNASMTLPTLTSSTAIVKETQYLYLFSFAAVVGKDQDAVLGQMEFSYRDIPTDSIVTVQKENTRRYRAFWAFVLSRTPLDKDGLLDITPLNSDGNRYFTVSDKTPTGYSVGTYHVWSLDPNLAENQPYQVLPDSFDLLPLYEIKRYQNYSERGYTYGYNGEKPIEEDINISVSAPISQESLDSHVWRRVVREVFAGIPGRGSSYGRTVQNLASGPVGGNPGFAGEAASSPNGSVAIANGQRISFTNQEVISRYAARTIQATNDGNGNALVIYTLNSPPSGTYFSENAANHQVFASDGTDITSLGRFQNLGGVGALNWIGGPNAASYLLPGQTCLFCPGIKYPSGSGFSIPFSTTEKVWSNGVELSQANIRLAMDDLAAYEMPANSEQFIVILGRERGALYYIYRHVSLTTNTNGTLVIPSTATGKIAFIQGVSGRIDKPIVPNLSPNTTYNCLLYYAPISGESWQFQFKYPLYEGASVNEAGWLNGAEVISKPQFFIHTQGGGQSVFRGDALLQFSPIAMHLPQGGSPRAYEFNAPTQLMGEAYPGPISFREMPLVSGAGLTLPAPGQILTTTTATTLQSRGLQIKLSVSGTPIGFRTPLLNNRAAFQSVLTFAVRKGADRRICVIVRNGRGAENVAADADMGVGIDIFKL